MNEKDYKNHIRMLKQWVTSFGKENAKVVFVNGQCAICLYHGDDDIKAAFTSYSKQVVNETTVLDYSEIENGTVTILTKYDSATAEFDGNNHWIKEELPIDDIEVRNLIQIFVEELRKRLEAGPLKN